MAWAWRNLKKKIVDYFSSFFAVPNGNENELPENY